MGTNVAFSLILDRYNKDSRKAVYSQFSARALRPHLTDSLETNWLDLDFPNYILACIVITCHYPLYKMASVTMLCCLL